MDHAEFRHRRNTLSDAIRMNRAGMAEVVRQLDGIESFMLKGDIAKDRETGEWVPVFDTKWYLSEAAKAPKLRASIKTRAANLEIMYREFRELTGEEWGTA